eukprot:1964292-Pyramimonas_sp.AAC.1
MRGARKEDEISGGWLVNFPRRLQRACACDSHASAHAPAPSPRCGEGGGETTDRQERGRPLWPASRAIVREGKGEDSI